MHLYYYKKFLQRINCIFIRRYLNILNTNAEN